MSNVYSVQSTLPTLLLHPYPLVELVLGIATYDQRIILSDFSRLKKLCMMLSVHGS